MYAEPEPLKDLPPVSLVVPAFNEEKSIKDTIESLLSLTYPKELTEIIIVNDGSTDRTAEIVRPYAERGEVIFIDNKVNKGKATALNMGIERATSEYVACLDADTVVEPDIIQKTLPYLQDPKVAAVMAQIHVRNPKNWLERIIAIEYSLGLGFYPKLFSYLDCLYLTPGQFSMYRRSILLKLGGFDPNNIVEDTEIAYRMQKARYKIKCCLSARAYTKVPRTLRDLYYQRKRWYSGTIQTILQHRDVFFNPKLGNFGMYFMPVNYGGALLGVLLFLSIIYRILHHLYLNIRSLSLISFDFYPLLINFLENYKFDPLTLNLYFFIGITPFIMNMIGCYIGLKTVGKSIRENLYGYLIFLFCFIPYNIFWIMCLYFVMFRREIKWRASM